MSPASGGERGKPGRLVVVRTSSRVAPGLLSLPAWQTLRGADEVLVASADHPQLPALDEAGIAWRLVPAEPAPARAARLIGLVKGATGPVVWLAAREGDDDLVRAVADAGSQATVLQGSCDLPGGRLLDLVKTMDVLRTDCPWDARQTHRSLAPHLIEESYEALEALEAEDADALREELGDVLLQVVFHARVAAERADGTGFTIDDVADAIVSKLVRRHPHVFGDVRVSGADEVKTNWDAIKAAERESKHGRPGSVLDGVPFGQPALALAAQLQRRAERAGVPAELADVGTDLGAALSALLDATPTAGLDPEIELRAAARKFLDRVQSWEQAAADGGPP
jgi:NTP pyrophosphatase (non-canonical NTP hydrolase)